MTQTTTRFARSADGTRISYGQSGAGPPLLLLHGGFDLHRLWRSVSPALEKTSTVFAVDLRGRGESGAYRPDFHVVEREYEDVAAVVREIGEPAHLLGHSSGARYALHAALLVPESLRSLVLYEPPPFFLPPPEIREGLERLEEAGVPDDILSLFLEGMAETPAEAVAQMRGAPRWRMAAGNARTFPVELRAVSDYRFDGARFAGLEVLTLLMVGGKSPPTFVAEAAALALPDARISALAGQGHEAMFTAPDTFASEVMRFLAEHG